MRSLAADTDGDAIGADLDAGLQRAAAQSSAYYLLRYRRAHPDDGKFREVQVLPKRNGVQLRARKGYTAASPDEALRAELLKQMNEPKPVVPTGTGAARQPADPSMVRRRLAVRRDARA